MNNHSERPINTAAAICPSACVTLLLPENIFKSHLFVKSTFIANDPKLSVEGAPHIDL